MTNEEIGTALKNIMALVEENNQMLFKLTNKPGLETVFGNSPKPVSPPVEAPPFRGHPQDVFKALFQKEVGFVVKDLGDLGSMTLRERDGFKYLELTGPGIKGVQLLGPNADWRALNSQYPKIAAFLFKEAAGDHWFQDYVPGSQSGLSSSFTGIPYIGFSCGERVLADRPARK